MTKRRALAIAAVLLILAVAVWWQRGRSKDGAGAGDATSGGGAGLAGATTNPRERAKVDVHAQPKASIAGTVTSDDGGAGIAGAQVCATGWSKDLSGEETREPVCATTDDQGRYELPDLLPANYSLTASAPTYIPARYEKPGERWSSVRLAAGQRETGIDIALRGGAVEVHGTVVDIGGGTVAGALVSVGSGGWWGGNASAVTRSDAEGNFSAWAKPGNVSVNASADGYAAGWKSGVAPGQHFEVRLTPESVLAGRVVEAGSDRPVERALVSVEGEFSFGNYGGSGSAFTDSEGKFRITRISPGRYKPSASGMGLFGEARQSVRVGLGETVDGIVIEVHAAFVVTGKIVIGETDEPCTRGSVSLREQDKDLRRSAGTEPDGSVEFRAVLPGTYKVSVSCQEWLEEDEYPDLVVADKDVLDQVWKVHTGAVIRGLVKTSTGEPVSDANVRGQATGAADPRGQRTWGWDQSERDGTYKMTGLVGGTYNVSVNVQGYPEPEEPTKVEVAEGGEAVHDIVLEAGGRIEGAVVDEHGKPVAGARVRAQSNARWGGWRNNTTTRDDGTFAIEGVRPGVARVIATSGRGSWWGGSALKAPGASDDDTHGKEVTVKAGQTEHVRLVVESQSGVIRGRVVDSDGNPVTDAFVDAQRESEAAGVSGGAAGRRSRWSWGGKPVLTDTDGRFELEELSPGKYTVRAYRRGGGDALAEGVEVGSDVIVTIETTGSIAGTVRVDGGSPPEIFTISVSDRAAGFSRSERFFRTHGEWTMDDLPAGKFMVSVSAGEGTAKQEVELAQGQETGNIHFVLEALAKVTGTFVALDTGKPLPGLRVMARPVKGGGSMSYSWGDDEKNKITDAEGRFELERVAPGKVWISAFPLSWEDAEYGWSRRLATVEAGKTTDVGTIKVARRRIKGRERGGDLGFTLKQNEPDVEPEDIVLEVALVRADGPAANSGLQVGDVITSIDGHEVTGTNVSLYYALARVPEGTAITLGLKRGDNVQITAAKPL